MQRELTLAVRPPFRLDLTVSALRRLPSNSIDLFTADGEYLRLHDGAHAPMLVTVQQRKATQLDVCLEGDAADAEAVVASLARILGVERDLNPFYRAARGVAWLNPLAQRMRGVKPPRYPTLWEACVNAIVFQQLSLIAASAIVRRMIALLAPERVYGAYRLRAFPRAEHLLAAEDGALRATGLSAVKVATLRRVAQALLAGRLDEASLQAASSAQALATLCTIKGIGPWSATIVLLRGLGCLEVFPGNDSGVARSLASVAGSSPAEVTPVLERLGEQRGMLYFHLLLARLEAQGEIGSASLATLGE